VKLREELANKSIGDVYSVNALFGHIEWRDRGFRKDLGAGTTLDMGIYCIQVRTTWGQG
jgi:predicted dehydrogenase